MSAVAQSAPTASAATERRPILEAAGITKRFVKRLDLAGRIAQRLGSSICEETVHAVDGVDLVVGAGEVVGLVGESGCGKSTFGRMVAGILPPTAGTLAFDGKPVWRDGRVGAKETALAIQMIFQDPFASLDPRMRVEEIMRAHQVRRLPVVDPEGILVGIVSITDLARRAAGERGQGGERRAAAVGAEPGAKPSRSSRPLSASWSAPEGEE